MSKFAKLFIILICVGITVAVVYGGLSKPKSVEEMADEMYNPWDKEGMPSVSVLVAKDDEIILEKSYGLSNVETGEKATPTTNYRLGCVTKPFTSMGILLLKEKGLIDLDWPTRRVLTDLPEYMGDVTIRQLLQNSSGLPNYQELWPIDGKTLCDKDVYELIKKLKKLRFQPGERVDYYSDTNYVLLALVVEEVSGMKFQDFLAENIFEPLGMENTVALVEGYNVVPERAYGTVRNGNDFVVEDQHAWSAVLGDGGVYSNVHDLYIWNQALQENKLVSAETMKDALKTEKGITEKYWYATYSSGWYMEKFNKSQMVYTPGGTIGFRNMFLRIPEEKLCVIILTNMDMHWSIEEDSKKLALAAIKLNR